MQNTDINNITNNSSTLKDPEAIATQLPKMKMNSENGLYEIKKHKQNFLRKLIAFMSAVFSGKAFKKSATKEQKYIVLLEKEAAEKTAIQENPAPVITEPEVYNPQPRVRNTLRELAEHQFMNMDVSQETRN